MTRLYSSSEGDFIKFIRTQNQGLGDTQTSQIKTDRSSARTGHSSPAIHLTKVIPLSPHSSTNPDPRNSRSVVYLALCQGGQARISGDTLSERSKLGKNTNGVQFIGVFWSPAEHTATDVARFLFHIPDLDCSQPVLLMGCASILQLSSLGIVGGQRLHVQVKFQGHIYNLETPAILDIKLPPQYYMSSLKEEDASVVWTHWKAIYFDTEDGIRHDIAHLPSVSIRKHSPTDSVESLQKEAGENLVSWIRTTKNGWMGNTFTQLQHRRKGLASKATLALARQLLQKGLLAYVIIENNNTASMKFHNALGFKWQCAFCTLELLPVDKNI
ncbi:hypothetical protein O3P69_018979 [Scylla paramamosain]|uniref:GCN5-related N-acetyltransferase Rv2170-like domain-containing protein n=1 Tax=Scylla paramamosain TaxID=85552 RepID=A0AAW0S9P9_SCYPA